MANPRCALTRGRNGALLFSCARRPGRLTRSLQTFLKACLISIVCPALFAQASSTRSTVVSHPSSQALANTQDGYARLSRNDLKGAQAAFLKAIALQPELASAHHGLGLALWRAGKKDAALREFTQAEQIEPSNADFHLDLARAAWSLADESQPSQGAGSSGSEVTLDAYRELAISEMRKALALKPQDAGIHLNLAELYLELHQTRDAAAQAQEAARLKPDARAFVILGQTYWADGNEVQALSQYEKAIQLDPHDGEGYLAIGQLQLREGHTAEAEKAFREAIQASPNLATAYAALGQIFQQTHRPDEARSAFERVLALNPEDWESAYRLGELMAEAGKTQRATDLFQRALQLHPEFPAAREQLALGFLRRGDFSDAAAQAQIIATHNPQAPEGHRVMALVLWKQRNYDASLTECAMALNADPNSTQMLVIQSLDLWQQGRRREARRALAEAVKRQPRLASSMVFCQLVLCDAQDIGIISDFMSKNRWILNPLPPQP